VQDYDENRSSDRHSVLNLIDHRISLNSEMTAWTKDAEDAAKCSFVIPEYNEKQHKPGLVLNPFCVCAVFVGNPLATETCIEPLRCVA